MSSYLRNLQRKIARNRASYEPKEQPVRHYKDGSYSTLRPTRGWLRVSLRRVWAMSRVAQLLDHVLPERSKKPRKVYHQSRPCPPSVDSRQQRRARERGK